MHCNCLLHDDGQPPLASLLDSLLGVFQLAIALELPAATTVNSKSNFIQRVQLLAEFSSAYNNRPGALELVPQPAAMSDLQPAQRLYYTHQRCYAALTVHHHQVPQSWRIFCYLPKCIVLFSTSYGELWLLQSCSHPSEWYTQ